MTSHLSFRPDLNDAILEDRAMMATGVPSFLYPTASPMILTTSGFVMITTPSVISSATGSGILSLGFGFGGGSFGPGGASGFSVTPFGLGYYAASLFSPNLMGLTGSANGNGPSGSATPTGGGRSTVTNAVVGGTQPGTSVFQFIGQTSGSGFVTGGATNSNANTPASGTNAAPTGANGQPPVQIGAPPQNSNTSPGNPLPTVPSTVPTFPRGPGMG